jgi:hypothetical protein
VSRRVASRRIVADDDDEIEELEQVSDDDANQGRRAKRRGAGSDDGDHDDDGDDDEKKKKAAPSKKAHESQSSGKRAPPKKKKKGGDDDDDDGDGDGDAAFAVDDDGGKKKVQLPLEEELQLVVALMRYALCLELSKQPMTSDGINKFVMGKYSGSRLVPSLIPKAQTMFRRLFGYELVPLTKADAKGKAVSAGMYALTSTLPPEVRALIPQRDELFEQMGLLTTIVALLNLSDGKLTKDALYAQLARLGLDAGTVHPTFGEWEKLIDNVFVTQQKYLHKATVKNGNAVVHEYHVGARARAELDERQMLHFVANVYGDAEIDPMMAKELIDVQMQRADEDGLAWAKEEDLRPLRNAAAAAAAVANNAEPEEQPEIVEAAAAEPVRAPQQRPRPVSRRR